MNKNPNNKAENLAKPVIEYYFLAKAAVLDKKMLRKAIKKEWMHCWHGIINGNPIDWKKAFFYSLWEQGYIVQTEESIQYYGDFSK